MSSTYLICDKDNKIMILDGIKMFGKKVRMPAMFSEETDALDILFVIEQEVGVGGHMVKKINSSFAATEG